MKRGIISLIILASALLILFISPIHSYAEEDEQNKIFFITNVEDL